MMDLAVDALFCILYLAETQYVADNDKADYPDPYWLFVSRPHSLWLVAVAMSSWNVMSALIRFVFADSKWGFIFSIQTLLDTVTALPFLLSAAFLPTGRMLYVPYFLRSWSVISRLQRALSIGLDIGISDQPFDPVKAKLIGLVAYFVAILYNGVAAFLYCETNFAPKTGAPPHTIWDAFYFILITASTVGYGDITPKSYEAKVVVMVFIVVALSVVPGLIAGTIETIKLSRAGGGSYTQRRGVDGVVKQYLVMIGDFQSSRRVGDMLNGFFNKEFSEGDVRVVFLSRNKPSDEVTNLLDLPMYKNRTTMLVGNGLDEIDLQRCQARDAAGVFIFPDRVQSDLESQDTLTTLLAWSLRLYAPSTRVFTFNLLPETGSFQWGMVEESICISDVKQLLLAYNCRHQGTATLILNLLHPSEPANSYENGWQAQYGDGTGNELYFTSVPDVFIGWTFAQVSWFVFQEFQSILIGVDIFLRRSDSSTFKEPGRDGPHSHDPSHLRRSRSFGRVRRDQDTGSVCSSKGEYHLTLNPGNSYRLGKFDHLIFIAQSPKDVDTIKDFTCDQYERLVKDERGHMDGSNVDFAKAMDMYYELRESRAGARAAAKRRAELRKGRKAVRQTEGGQKIPARMGHDDGTMTEKNPSMHNEKIRMASPVQKDDTLEATDGSATNMKSKKVRPAWNVALYEEDDDDDDDDDDDNAGGGSNDTGSLNQATSAQSSSSQPTNNSRDNNSKVMVMFRRRSTEYHRGQRAEFELGALDREDSLQRIAQEITLSQHGNDQERKIMAESSPIPPPSPLNYPSNFELNAAAAAAATLSPNNDIPQQNNDFVMDSLLQRGRSESENVPGTFLAEDSVRATVVIPEFTDTGGSAKKASKIVKPPRDGRRSVHKSFLPLDETTYIGQALITRSKAQDLPLCHLLFNPPDSVKTLVRDDLSSLKDHIVVCADVGEDLYRFISTLRLAQIAREDLKTIVVLCPDPLVEHASESSLRKELHGHDKNTSRNDAHGQHNGRSGETWEAILSFPRVFWVTGNCRHQRDLVRAGILGASSIVVMSHNIRGLDRDEFADSTVIMAHYMIYQTLRQRNLLGRQHIVVEMLERSNIRFLNMRDINMIQSYQGVRNPGLRIGSTGFWMTPIFASGQVLITSLLDNVLFQAYSKTHILDLVKLCCGVRFKQAIELDQILGIDCSNVCLIETPDQFVGKPFLNLFQAMALLHGIIPLGLFRAPDREFNNTLPFVFTNPLPGILLKATDMIYVLKP
ncbi:potassium channel, sub T, member 1 [Mortierella sp. NVP85]|nr:potassium channel, sub T, member 1 [Mortierella sp. NVP85]